MVHEPGAAVSDEGGTSVEERRGSIRHHPIAVGGAGLLARGGDLSARGRIHDLSAGGIGVILDQPVPVGALLDLQLRTAGDERIQEFSLRVAHCADQEDGTWLVGGPFLSRPSGLDLLTLLT